MTDPAQRTIAELDDEIAADRIRYHAAQDSGFDSDVTFYVFDIERLENLQRIVAKQGELARELRAAQRRHLSERYAHANWSNDPVEAAKVLAEIERFERA